MLTWFANTKRGALANTVVVVASATDLQRCNTLHRMLVVRWVRYFRDRGEDALIVYDDLSKQAVAYRQIHY
ncbi:hypothetical protein O9993_14640 [Vibrio lentus]|nr:hypothetical protein [Vibrio lentus]